MIDANSSGAGLSGRPLPEPDEQTAPFWEAASRGVLTLARCSQCEAMTLPPDLTCPHCHSAEPAFTFAPVEGRGRIRTWTTIRRSFLQGFATPFVLVDVELDGHHDVRLIGQLLDGPDAALAIGLPVTVEFERLDPDIAVPAFRLEQVR